ncbi:MAG: phosphate-selective porin OprO and OprP [Acidobacteriota bacterium]|jgi:phosphate-selective porin OprO/OprP|nr:phosphate-selective porin OprO and OprP [Acidobacteriota bacterium]
MRNHLLFGLGCAWLLTTPTLGQTAQTPEPASQNPPAAESPQTPEQRIEELDQKVRILERRGEVADEQAAEKAKSAASVTAGRDGFSIRSADNAFQLRLRGYVQLDGRFYQDEHLKRGVDTFILRRARPILEGTVFKIFDFRLMPDFGGGTTVLQDAYVNARFLPGFQVRAGKFKPPVGLERLQSATDILFVERALPTNLVPNRDLGVQLQGDFGGSASNRISYALGVFNGVADAGNGDLDTNNGKDTAGRIFFTPFAATAGPGKGLGVGIAASTGNQSGTATSAATTGLPSYKTGGQLTFFSYRADGTAAGTTLANGRRQRLSPQAYWYAGPFGLLAEYVRSSQEVSRGAASARIENDAWQAAASYVLFGGETSYRGVDPKQPFDSSQHHWGALELAARYNRLEVDDKAFPFFANPASAASRATAWAVGLNWYLTRGVRFMLDYEQTRFKGGAATGNRPDEKVVLDRIQISF